MKRTLLVLTLLASGFWAVRAQEPYFTKDELPDLVKCLPAPPEKGSSAFKYDVQRYKWGKKMRSNAVRAAIAERDAYWNLDTLAAIFSEPFGLKIDRETTPEIYKAFMSGVKTIELIRINPKAHFKRQRPFDRFREHLYTTWEEDELRGEGSYPSGHTIRGWAAALLLAEINPAAADDLFARGWEYGESRVIVGAHWQSDVDASRPAAGIGYSYLQTSAAFRAQMALAQDEFRRLTKAAGQKGREHFVSLTEAVPDAILEIRYFGTYNFVGKRIDGYLAPTALLTKEAADSLKAVSDDVMRRGYRLKIYDAYRPQCAVDHFVRWSQDPADTLTKRYFYPMLDKPVLFEQNYIMEKSGHTRGSTVDLTLFDMSTEKEVDMGGTFDWFGRESHPDYTGITPEQFANRMILRDAMLRHGFKPLDSEWWHFTLKNEPFPDTYFTFPVM